MSPSVPLLTFLSLAFESLLVLATATSPQDPDLQTLKLVHVVMRSGDRNPLTGHALSPYKEEDWLGGYGYLTQRGEKQSYELGDYLRHRYDGFLNRFYEQNEISALSSDTDRSIRSGISTLRGLFLRVGKRSSGDSQIVPIRTVPRDEDNFISMSAKCPQYDRELSSYLLNSPENWEWEEKGMKILQATVSDTRFLGTALNEDKSLFDNIQVQRFQKKLMPDWVTPELEEFIKSYRIYGLRAETGTEMLKKFRSIILQKIIENMEECVGNLYRNETKMRKLVLYSGHDTTLTTILNILKVPDFDPPSYASAVIIELHKDSKNQDYHIEIFYRNDVKEPPLKLEIMGCHSRDNDTISEPYCFLNRFKAMMEPLFPQDYQKECEVGGGVKKHLLWIVMIIGLALYFVIL